MDRLDKKITLYLVQLLNIVVMTVIFSFIWFHNRTSHSHYSDMLSKNLIIVIISTALYFILGKTYDAFQLSILRISELIYSQFLAILISEFITYLIICLLEWKAVNPLPVLLAVSIQMFWAVIWSTLAHYWYFKVFEAKRSAIIYDDVQELRRFIAEPGIEKKFQVVTKLEIQECKDFKFIENEAIDTVFLCGLHSHDRNQILKFCIINKINVNVVPRIGDILMNGGKRSHVVHIPTISFEGNNQAPMYLFIKRMFDILSSLIMITLTLPLMLSVALAIKLTDGGPVFYRQTRLTKNGREFTLLKFRSMVIDAEDDGIARLSTGQNDERITPVGQVIRKIRLDELPQLLNILKGDMSVVGPRPERPEIMVEYQKYLPEFVLRLQVKAGLTGYAQIYGKYNSTPYNKLQMDLIYIAHPSILEDLRLIFKTIKIIFLPESTEGVLEGQITAYPHIKDEQNDEKKYNKIKTCK